MDTVSPSMRDLARRLLALEAGGRSTCGAPEHEAVRVCEKLRVALTRFAGSDGFASLLRRALAMARAQVPALQAVKINPDGSLEGLEALAAEDGQTGAQAAVATTAHLLGLLATFIGEPLTRRLVREAWPEAPLEATLQRNEAVP